MKQAFLVLILVCLGVWALALPVFSEEDSFKLGMDAYYVGKYSQACTYYDKVIKAEKEYFYDAFFYKTLCYFNQHNLALMKITLEAMNKKGFDVGYLHWRLAELYLNVDGMLEATQFDEALAELQKAAIMGMDSALFHRDLGETYFGLAIYDKAVTEYNRAIDMDPTLEECYLSLARAYIQIGNYVESLKILQIASNLGVDELRINICVGDLKLAQGDYAAAAKFYEEALQLNNAYSEAHLKVAIAYYQLGKDDEAKKHLLRNVEAQPKMYQAYYYLGQIEFSKGNYTDAIRYYNLAIKYNPSYGEAYVALGGLYLKRGNPYQAVSQFTSAIEKCPNYAAPHIGLANAYVALDMKEASIAELRKALRMDPNNKDALDLLTQLLKK